MLPENRKPIILYFDEAHHLQDRATQDQVTCYDALCTALNALVDSKGVRAAAFGVFLSTNSSLAQPPKQCYSHRVYNENRLLAPFTELPFDVHPKFPFGDVALDELHTESFMCRFGRPL